MHPHTLLNNKRDIEAWLQMYGVQNYTINPDMSVNVQGDVDISERKLRCIGVQFNHVSRTFICQKNRLTSLLGSPNTVGGSFYCSDNFLTSLHHAPKRVPQSFICSDNQLRNLEHCPQFVGRIFGCDHNKIETLEFCPAHVGMGFYCENNPLLGEAQDINDLAIIQKFQAIHAERSLLQKNTLSHTLSRTPTHKI